MIKTESPKKAAILAIGTEITTGEINNTNAGVHCGSLPIVPRHFVMNSTGLTPGSLTDCSSMLIVIVLID
jgi:hypothetical protein